MLAIGLDSVDPKLLMDWCDAGDLPTLARIRDEGVWGTLETPAAMADDAVWASFSTCEPPAEHGRYHFQTVVPGAYELRRFRRQHFRHPPFWQILSSAGKRVAVIDVPKSPAAGRLNGIEIRDFRVHGNEGSITSTPADLAAELSRRFGDDRTDRVGSDEYLCDRARLTSGQRADFFQRLHQSVVDKTTLATELLAQGDWDLFLTVYKEGHCAGHQCWPPDEDLKSIYRALDVAVGNQLRVAGPDPAVIVFSTLGMGANHTGNHLLDKVLQRLESRSASPWHTWRASADRLYHGLRNRLGTPAHSSRYRSRLAYQVAFNEISGAIRINLRGREPEGRVEPGAGLTRLTRFLETELLALNDPNTGLPVVAQVLNTQALSGEHSRGGMPDLFVVWNRFAPITAVTSPAIGVVSTPYPGLRPGNHVPGGIYFARGPGIAASPVPGHALIEDIGPTIARLLNTRLDDADRAVIQSIV